MARKRAKKRARQNWKKRQQNQNWAQKNQNRKLIIGLPPQNSIPSQGACGGHAVTALPRQTPILVGRKLFGGSLATRMGKRLITAIGAIGGAITIYDACTRNKQDDLSKKIDDLSKQLDQQAENTRKKSRCWQGFKNADFSGAKGVIQEDDSWQKATKKENNMVTNKKRLLLIDDDFDPRVNTVARQTLCSFIEAFKSAGYEIGPSDFAGCTKCPDGDFGLSVYNPKREPNDHAEKSIFNYPSADQADSEHGSMFFATDAAFDYFFKFVTEDSRWNEIDAVVIDIMMPPGTLLPKKYKRANVVYNNAGDYLKRYLKELVAEYRILQNPDVILPVMVLTNKILPGDRGIPLGVNQGGRQPKPQDGDLDRLWVWNMEKTYALKHPEFLVKNLNQIVAGRVK